jgi:hypothetical protein
MSLITGCIMKWGSLLSRKSVTRENSQIQELDTKTPSVMGICVSCPCLQDNPLGIVVLHEEKLTIITLSVHKSFKTTVSEQTLKELKISLQVSRILKTFQNVQSVGGHIHQLNTMDTMAERGGWREIWTVKYSRLSLKEQQKSYNIRAFQTTTDIQIKYTNNHKYAWELVRAYSHALSLHILYKTLRWPYRVCT